MAQETKKHSHTHKQIKRRRQWSNNEDKKPKCKNEHSNLISIRRHFSRLQIVVHVVIFLSSLSVFFLVDVIFVNILHRWWRRMVRILFLYICSITLFGLFYKKKTKNKTQKNLKQKKKTVNYMSSNLRNIETDDHISKNAMTFYFVSVQLYLLG